MPNVPQASPEREDQPKRLTESIQEKLDKLKKHPFSVKNLESLAQFLTGDKSLRLTPIKGKKWKYVRKTNEILIPVRHLQEDSADRKDGLQILGVLLHEIGHHKFTNFKHIKKITDKAKELGLPEKVFSFFHNTVEDPRVNHLMMTEEQASVAIDYIYEIDWAKRSVEMLPTLADGVTISEKEKLQRARYKQFGYNIIYFWRHKEYMPGTSEEIKEALQNCQDSINQAIYTFDLEQFDPDRFEDLEDFYKARAKLAYKLITSEPIWSTYVELVKKDIDELGNIEEEEDEDENPPGIPPEDDIPPEDQDEYYPQDMESQEAAGEAPHLFKIEPAPKESYFESGIRSHFDKSTRRWRKVKRLQSYNTPDGLDSPHIFSGKIHGLIALPLPKGSAIDLESMEHSGGSISVKVDQHGVIYLQSNELQEFSIQFGEHPDFDEEEAGLEEEKKLYSINLSSKTEKLLQEAKEMEPENAARHIENYIRSNKKYNVKAQGKLYKSATNSDVYFRRIDQAEELECYTSNTFLVGLCRQIGISARMASGHHVTGSKDNTKKITRNTGHAWSEIWDGDRWVRLDATPSGGGEEEGEGEGEEKDPKDKLNEDAEKANEELESQMEETDEDDRDDLKDNDYKESEEQENKPVEKKEGKGKEIDFEALKNVDPELVKIFENALEVIEPHTREIIEVLTQVETEEDIEKIRQQLFQKRRKKKHGLAFGQTISSRQQAISEILTGGDKVMMKNQKMKPQEVLRSERLDCEFSVAVDLSGSMGGLNDTFDNFELLSKKSHAFLGILTILQVCAYFHIPCNIVLFADRATHIKPEESWYYPDGTLNTPEIVKTFVKAFKDNTDNRGQDIGGGNAGNGEGVRLALKALEDSTAKRQLAMVMSDGDGDNSQFLNESSRRFFEEKDNLYSLGLGIGIDASHTTENVYFGYPLSVIESQFHSKSGQPGYERTKGVNVGDFRKLVSVLKKELFNFLSRGDVIYKSGEAQ